MRIEFSPGARRQREPLGTHCTSIPSLVLVSVIGAAFIFKQLLEGNTDERMSLSAEKDGFPEEGHLDFTRQSTEQGPAAPVASRAPSCSSWGLSLMSNT